MFEFLAKSFANPNLKNIPNQNDFSKVGTPNLDQVRKYNKVIFWSVTQMVWIYVNFKIYKIKLMKVVLMNIKIKHLGTVFLASSKF